MDVKSFKSCATRVVIAAALAILGSTAAHAADSRYLGQVQIKKAIPESWGDDYWPRARALTWQDAWNACYRRNKRTKSVFVHGAEHGRAVAYVRWGCWADRKAPPDFFPNY